MIRLLSIGWLLLCVVTLPAQRLSQKEGFRMAEELRQVGILSPQGYDELRDTILIDNWEREISNPLGVEDTNYYASTLSSSHLLLFLQDAFTAEFYYRLGLQLQIDAYEHFSDSTDNHPADSTLYSQYAVYVDSLMAGFRGHRIETAIGIEDSIGDLSYSIPVNWAVMRFSGAPHSLIGDSRSVLGKTRTRTARDLLRVGLITEAMYEGAVARIRAEELPSEKDVVGYLAERVIEAEDYTINKQRQLLLVEALHEANVLSPAGYRFLTEAHDSQVLYTKFELLPYCDSVLFIDTNELPADIQVAYREIFNGLRGIIPDFEISDLEVAVYPIDTGYNDLIEYWCGITFRVQDKTYTNEFWYDLRRVEDGPPTFKLSTDFHAGINKFLREQSSPYRLYHANNRNKGPSVYGEEVGALIVLTQQQVEAWNSGVSKHFLSAEDHDNTLTTANLTTLIDTYEALGLFDHLTQEERVAGRQCVASSTISAYHDIVHCFPDVLVIFDWETGNLENPYEELTQAFAAASRGAFRPRFITDSFAESWERPTTAFAFDFRGQTYATDLSMDRDWLDGSFLELIQQALVDAGIDGRYYYCVDGGQVGGYIFLTADQHRYLTEEQPGFFPGYD